MKELIPYLVFDLLLVLGLPLLMWRQLSFWHPIVAYLFFHFYCFTWRLIGLINGELPMYAELARGDPIRLDEFERAMIWADLALVIFCVASHVAQRNFSRHTVRSTWRRLYSKRVINAISALALPLGFAALFIFKAGVVTAADVGSSGYFTTAAIWPIGCVGLLVFVYGFRWYLIAMGLLYLAVVSLQGHARFMLVLPLILFTAYYLQSRGRKWPTMTILIGAFLLAAIFPQLKRIGQAYQTNDWDRLFGLVGASFSGAKGDVDAAGGEGFLDQYAGSLTMIDMNGEFYRGRTYLAILTLPVPRALWADKPGLADHTRAISTVDRQYGQEGRIITYLGESYINFGYIGFMLVPALLGYVLTYWCLRATSGPFDRFDRFIYVFFFMSFIQLFRDGLASIVVFTFAHNIPIFIVWILHLIPGVAPRVLDKTPSLARTGITTAT